VENGVEKTDKAASPKKRHQYGRRRDLEQQPHDTSASPGASPAAVRRRAGPCGRCRLPSRGGGRRRHSPRTVTPCRHGLYSGGAPL